MDRLQMFPDVYKCRGHTQFTGNIDLATSNTPSYFTVQIQSNGIVNNISTMVNQSGTLGSVLSAIPSGLGYLLGDSNRGGSNVGGNAPYYNYRITNQIVKVYWMPAAILNIISTQPFNIPSEVICTFTSSTFANQYQMTTGSLSEQAFTVTRKYPSYLTGPPSPLVNSAKTLEVWGDTYKSSIEQAAFTGAYNTSPANPVYCQVTFVTIAPNAVNYALNGSYVIDFYQDFELFQRVPLNIANPV
jgi:hypothetical protein